MGLAGLKGYFWPTLILEVYYIKNKKSGKKKWKYNGKKIKILLDSIPGLRRESPRTKPLDHLRCIKIVGIFNNYILKQRVLRSCVTVYLPRSLSCANYWNKLNKWHSNWGSSLNPYRLWITIILNITYLIIRILKGVDAKLRVNLWTFCEK